MKVIANFLLVTFFVAACGVNSKEESESSVAAVEPQRHVVWNNRSSKEKLGYSLTIDAESPTNSELVTCVLGLAENILAKTDFKDVKLDEYVSWRLTLLGWRYDYTAKDHDGNEFDGFVFISYNVKHKVEARTGSLQKSVLFCSPNTETLVNKTSMTLKNSKDQKIVSVESVFEDYGRTLTTRIFSAKD